MVQLIKSPLFLGGFKDILYFCNDKYNFMVYYKYLFLHMGDLTPNEGLVYSELLFHSLVSNKDYRTGDLLYIDKVKEDMINYQLMRWEESVPYYSLSVRELMDRTELTFPTVKKAVASLESKEYIKNSYIMCPLDLLEGGYIKVLKNTELKGRQLIFYSYLVDRSRRYKGIIDTWAYRFKELCGVDTDDAYFMIKQLKKKGLLERLDDGRLKVNKPRRQNKKEETSQSLPW